MNTIYIRTLKKADHTVFCVAEGQKQYWDPQFRTYVPFSSGQQVKRSLIDTLCANIGQVPSPTTFLFDITKQKEFKEGEVYGTCDPSYADQLFGGWMKAAKGGKDRTLKRRSPLSISAMRALHPLLATVYKEDASFDRSERPNNQIIVRDTNGNELSAEEVSQFLEEKDRSLSRKWIPDNKRASGLFVVDMAIDLRRLFCVSLNSFEPEMSAETIEKLREEGWKEGRNVFGPCLIAPASLRELWIEGLADAITSWKIGSNQARTFSLMDTLAISVSEDANLIAGSIRATLSDEEYGRANPVIEESLAGVDSFITLQADGYLKNKGVSADALKRAKDHLVSLMASFDYENQ